MFYPYVLLIHLLCAIFFIGYLFVDIFILGNLKKKNPNLDKELFQTIGVKIMPFIVIILLLSGGAMISFHINPLNLLFLIKIFFAIIILFLVLFSLFYHFILKRKNPLGNFIHLLVFILCLGIVILAKLMNYFFISL
ncbi:MULTISPECIES: copper resistance protein CopD [Campylobacter]|uniref:copper resistance protein CopD n=1 Tax=Campylobacter TaxID=194 RepID=UPI001EC29C24|nr:copper resistance protein CopD [Campylobacter sp. W0014]MBZ7954286.1 copper resistance protein CopD [Campylobacter sp. W0018]